MDARLKSYSTFIIAGPSQSGKTTFVNRLLESNRHIFTVPANRILWYYGITKPKGYLSKQGLPQDLDDFKENDFIILDDLMSKSERSDLVTDMITNVVHHRKCTVFIITQNLLQQGKSQRTRHLNAHYLVVFKNPRDRFQIQVLANQMYGKQSRFLVDAYRDATRIPHGYLLIDLRQETPDELRIRTRILPHEGKYTVYINIS